VKPSIRSLRMCCAVLCCAVEFTALSYYTNTHAFQVRYLLMKGFAGANDRTPDDEPLFLYVLCKATAMDTATGSLDAESAKKDTSDRKKLQKILSLFVKYNANVNTMGGCILLPCFAFLRCPLSNFHTPSTPFTISTHWQTAGRGSRPCTTPPRHATPSCCSG